MRKKEAHEVLAQRIPQEVSIDTTEPLAAVVTPQQQPPAAAPTPPPTLQPAPEEEDPLLARDDANAGSGILEESTTFEPLPIMSADDTLLAVSFLNSGLTEKVAHRAGRDDVAGFDVLLRSAFTTDERALGMEVGDHGVSLRDPQGALMKVLPLEHLIGWSHKEGVKEHKDGRHTCELTLICSVDLVVFEKLIFDVADGKGQEIEEALQAVSAKRAEALAAHAEEHQDEAETPPFLSAVSRVLMAPTRAVLGASGDLSRRLSSVRRSTVNGSRRSKIERGHKEQGGALASDDDTPAAAAATAAAIPEELTPRLSSPIERRSSNSSGHL